MARMDTQMSGKWGRFEMSFADRIVPVRDPNAIDDIIRP